MGPGALFPIFPESYWRLPMPCYFLCSKDTRKGRFQGFGPNGKTFDWKSWYGSPHGYEGFLVDHYQALPAVLSR